MKIFSPIKKLYITSTGYSYTHLGRLFLRLFVGLMLMQFGIRQWIHFGDAVTSFPVILGIPPAVGLTVLIGVEVVCSLFIMVGFITRIMIIPPFVAMIIAEHHILHNVADTLPYELSWEQPGYVPILFLGIYFFLLLVGPGKISIDYFLSLHLLHSSDHSEDELEEV